MPGGGVDAAIQVRDECALDVEKAQRPAASPRVALRRASSGDAGPPERGTRTSRARRGSAPAERQDRDGADASSLVRIGREALVAARLLGEDPIAVLALELGDIDLILAVTSFDAATSRR